MLEGIRHAIQETWQANLQLRRRLTVGLPAAIVPLFVNLPAPLSFGCFAVTIWALWPLLRINRVLQRGQPGVALWLRRFHDTRYAPALHRFLEGAVSSWGQMVTLADDTVRTPFFALYVYGAIAVLICLTMLIATALRGEPLAPMIVVTVVMILAIVALSRWQSVLGIETAQHVQTLPRRLRRIRRDKLRLSGFSKIVKCPSRDDEVWRLVIRAAVAEVDAVIIDVSEFSPNIEWEIRTVLSAFPAEKVVLIIREDLLGPDGGLSRDLSRQLAALFAGHGSPTLVAYPTRIPLLTGSTSFAPIVRAAAEVIGFAMLRGPRAAGVHGRGSATI